MDMCTKNIDKWITSDAAVLALAATAWPVVALSQPVTTLAFALECTCKKINRSHTHTHTHTHTHADREQHPQHRHTNM